MKVIVAPNAFKGSLGVTDVCRAMRAGVLDVVPDADVVRFPMSDGGDGLCEVMADVRPGFVVQTCDVVDALGRAHVADYLWNEVTGVAVIESAKANGIALLKAHERDVLVATSYGVGQLVDSAIGIGASEIVVGAGGSASVDGGLGCLQALGARVRTAGCEATVVPGGFSKIRSVDLEQARARVGKTKVTVLCDVDVPLSRGWAIFAPQKGASDADLRVLETGLRTLRDALGSEADHYWHGARGGAAGGVTAALELLGAELHEGAEWIASRIGLREGLEGADCVVTGEGRFDATSVVGKAPGCVLRAARAKNVRAAIVAGYIEREHGASFEGLSTCALTELTTLEEAMRDPTRWIREATRRVFE